MRFTFGKLGITNLFNFQGPSFSATVSHWIMTSGLSWWKIPFFMNRVSLHSAAYTKNFSGFKLKILCWQIPLVRENVCVLTICWNFTTCTVHSSTQVLKRKKYICTHKGHVIDFAKWFCAFSLLHFMLILLPAVYSHSTPRTHCLFPNSAPNSRLHTEGALGQHSPLIQRVTVDSASSQALGTISITHSPIDWTQLILAAVPTLTLRSSPCCCLRAGLLPWKSPLIQCRNEATVLFSTSIPQWFVLPWISWCF